MAGGPSEALRTPVVGSKAGSTELSASARKLIFAQGEVGSLIAPGGVFEQPEELNVKKDYARSRPKVTSYTDAYPGLMPAPEHGGLAALQPPCVQGLRSVVKPERTGSRTMERDPPDVWREQVQTYSRRHGQSDEVLVEASKAQHRRKGVGREEHEKRWRRWLKAKSRESDPDAATVSQVSGTVASTIPAGMRPSKAIGDSFPDGMRVAFFGEDKPKPIWTTLANAPWVSKVEPPREAKVEPPWLPLDDPSHPLRASPRGTASARGSGSARLSTPRVDGSVALSARGTSDTKPAGPAAGAWASPEERQARADRKTGSRTGSEAKSGLASSLASKGDKVLLPRLPEAKAAAAAMLFTG